MVLDIVVAFGVVCMLLSVTSPLERLVISGTLVVSGVASVTRVTTISPSNPSLRAKAIPGDVTVVGISVMAVPVKSLGGEVVMVVSSDDVMASVCDVVMVS